MSGRDFEERASPRKHVARTRPDCATSAPRPARAMAFLDGSILPEAELGLAWDHPGLRQGFGLFETIRIASGRAFLVGAHAQRITDSAPVLGIDPWLHPRSLTKGLDRLVAASGVRDGALRIFLLPAAPPPGEEATEEVAAPSVRTADGGTSGAGAGGVLGRGEGAGAGKGIRSDTGEPSIRGRYVGVISGRAAPRPSSARTVLSEDLRDPRAPLVGVKTISYAAERLLLARARAAGADECLRRNIEGRICEGTRSNIFLIEGERLVTPPLSEGLLPGVTRWFVLRIARDAGLTPREEGIPVDRLLAAEEAFLTSTLRGIVPIVAVGERPIGQGGPGPRSVRLSRILERHITRGYEP